MNPDIAILEIRGAVGGDEAKIWADDLLRMYLRFVEKQGGKINILDRGVLRLKAPQIYELLKNESGVHRVQRVPTTEKSGRIHTSTATVVVLPEITENEIRIKFRIFSNVARFQLLIIGFTHHAVRTHHADGLVKLFIVSAYHTAFNSAHVMGKVK